MSVLVTGSSGLIGSEAVRYYDGLGHEVVGVDNNMRRHFLGPDADVRPSLEQLRARCGRFVHLDFDVRNRSAVFELFRRRRFALIVHCAGQPSHDRSRDIPSLDFSVNVIGTVNLLEATRALNPDAVFVYMSTNKVYGSAPNKLPLVESATRFDFARLEDRDGIGETCSIDQTLHTPFGASKAAADIIAQEYGKSFGLKVGIFRAGCVTGAAHASVELHGFLSFLVKSAVEGREYLVHGYKGKQVRDNIHAIDVVRAFDAFFRSPRPGEVYNLGGGRENSLSVLEALVQVSTVLGVRPRWRLMEKNRPGDHICYISRLTKFRTAFPEWHLTQSVADMIRELGDHHADRLRGIASSVDR
jgi:CDP-paratose 2-epimerase